MGVNPFTYISFGGKKTGVAATVARSRVEPHDRALAWGRGGVAEHPGLP